MTSLPLLARQLRRLHQLCITTVTRAEKQNQVRAALITIFVLFLVLSSARHVKLRHESPQLSDILVKLDEKEATAEDYDEEDEVTEEEKRLLTKCFRTADFDGDKVLSETELTMAINRQTKQHILVS